MQQEHSTQLLKTEDERNLGMGVISHVMQLCHELAEYLEDVHDLAFEGELSFEEVEFWRSVRDDLHKLPRRQYIATR
jgi:hypothetical protein